MECDDKKTTGCSGEVKQDVNGQGICDQCDLVHEMPFTDAGNNSSSALGSGRTHEKGLGSEIGLPTNVPAGQRGKYWKWRRKERTWNKPEDPMYVQVKNAVAEMFGRNIADAVDLMTQAATKKLKGEDAEKRNRLSPGEARRLALPKTSLTRLGGSHHPEKRGGGMQANLHIIALAIRSLSTDYFGTPPIDEMDVRAQYDITKSQLDAAKKSIRQHFEKRIGEGMIKQPHSIQRRSPQQRREDDYNIALPKLMDVIFDEFGENLGSSIMHEYTERFIEIEGESIDSEHSNTSITMLAVCLMFQVLENRSLLDGKRSKLARAVDKSASGVRNALTGLQKHDPYGVFAPRKFVPGKNGIVRGASQHHPMDRTLYKDPKRFTPSSKPPCDKKRSDSTSGESNEKVSNS